MEVSTSANDASNENTTLQTTLLPSNANEDAANITVCAAEECPICLENLGAGKAMFTAECGHKFHFSCLLENVNHDEANSDKCPICRKPQEQWPESTSGLKKAHPHCTQCGLKSTGGTAACTGCGAPLAHTPTAAERARAAAQAAQARNHVVVECPSCRIRCLVSTSARGTLQCPNGHLFQVRMPSNVHQRGNLPPQRSRNISSTRGPPPPASQAIRSCPTCSVRLQMPPGSRPGQYMCPAGHRFHYHPGPV